MPVSLGRQLHKERLGLRLILVNSYVFAVRRVNSSEMLKIGMPTLEGSTAYTNKLAEHKKAIQRIEAGLHDPRVSDEDKAKIEARLEQENDAHRMTLAEAMIGTPERAAAYLEKCRAYTCAMVVKAGRLKEEVEDIAIEADIKVKVLPSDWDLAKYCEDLRTEEEEASGAEPMYMAPFSFVLDEDRADPVNNIVWVHAYDSREIAALGGILMGIQEVAGSITATFREGSRATAVPRNDGQKVESAPE